MRRRPGEGERHGLAFGDREASYGVEVLASKVHLRHAVDCVRPGDGPNSTLDLPHPGNDRAVIEPDHQIHFHGDLSADPFHQAHNLWKAGPWRHEVDHAGNTVVGYKIGFENQGVAAVAPPDFPNRRGRAQPPSAVLFFAQQRRKARAGIEPGQTQPVHGAVAPN